MVLLPDKAIYWKNQDILLTADVHIGKVQHFRKAGMAVPYFAAEKNIERLKALLDLVMPKRLVILGDLFHSDYNQEWELFVRLRAQYPEVRFELVRGNHDIIETSILSLCFDEIYSEGKAMAPFYFCHVPEAIEGFYCIAGHIHPGIILKVSARNTVRLPCFYFGDQYGILPAFGEFTGLGIINRKKKDLIYAIVEDTIMAV